MYLNDAYELDVGILPLNATNKNLKYESKDPLVAAIDNGILKGTGSGETEIIITDLH